MNKVLRGFSYMSQGLRLIRQPGLRRYAIVPVLINTIVFACLGWWLWHRFGLWLENLPLLNRWNDVWLIGVIQGALRFIVGAALFLFALFSFTLVANLIAAPFNSLLAEKIEYRLRGTEAPPTTARAVLASIPKTIGSELRKFLYLCLWLIPLALLYLIPLIQSVAPIITLLFGAWMFAIEYLDYPMGNHGHGFKQVRTTARSHRGVTVGFGMAVTAVTAIPVINLLAMPVAVAAATVLWIDLEGIEQKGDSFGEG